MTWFRFFFLVASLMSLPCAVAARPTVDDAEFDASSKPGHASEHGEALGHDKGRHKKSVSGSSSGIARGDFNGDDFADLAIGIPNRRGTVTGALGAGAAIVIYGSDDGLTGSDPDVPASQLLTEANGANGFEHFGSALASGDFDGDGISDIAVGVPGEKSGTTVSLGTVHIAFGSPDGLILNTGQLLRNPLGALMGGPSSDAFGSALAWGDFNGDGVGDLAVGVPNRDIVTRLNFPVGSGTTAENAGAVVVYYGVEGEGLDTENFEVVHQRSIVFDSTSIGDAAETNDRFGRTMTAGDFDHDGYTDLAIGVPFEELPAANVEDSGGVHVIYGSANGLNRSRTQIWNQDSSGIEDVAEFDDRFGSSLGAGDFNGDGFVDVVIGAPLEDIGSIEDAGAVNVIYGGSSGLQTALPADQFWHQDRSGVPDSAETDDLFGAAVTAGDFDGDGFRDLAVGAPEEDLTDTAGETAFNAGGVVVIYGGNTPDNGLSPFSSGTRPAAQFWSQGSPGIDGTIERLDNFGAALSAWNFGKGNPTDLAIGVPGEELQRTEGAQTTLIRAGTVNVIYGTGSGLSSTGDQHWFEGKDGVIPGSLSGSASFGGALY